jgi:carbamoyltransferase
MIVLGINGSHDGSLAIVKDGKLIKAVSAERTHRVKKWAGFTPYDLNYLLDECNIKLKDIDLVAFADLHRQINNLPIKMYQDDVELGDTHGYVVGNEVRNLSVNLMGRYLPGFLIPHQLSHAAASFYTSNFSESWCFTMDGTWDMRANSAIHYGNKNKLSTEYLPGLALGHFYSKATRYIGLGSPLFKAGSLMGLASYGKPIDQIVNRIEYFISKMYFPLDTDWETVQKTFNDLLAEIYAAAGCSYFGEMPKTFTSTKAGMDISATVQYIFEQTVLDALDKHTDKSKSANLCLSGGSMLNCNSNSLVRDSKMFNNIHHFPACTDDGNSVGAALYVSHNLFNIDRHNYLEKEIAYLGKDYDVVEPNYEFIANSIANGKIVAWFMGASEFGPRALGHRSILADPRNQHTRDLLNFAVKKREWFRPFAPIVLEHRTQDWFDFEGTSPYMLYTAKVLKPEIVPAITHIDGTARMQTVNYETNPEIYKLLEEFEKITGVPMLVNTSLNADSEPILETEQDAIMFFENNSVDILVLNGKIITK